MTVKERFEKKINDLKTAMAEGKISKENFDIEYKKITNAMNVLVGTAITNEEKTELDNQLNVINVENQAEKNNKTKTGLKVAAAIGAVATGAVGLFAACNSETKENENQEINSLDAVNNTLSTFVNDCLNNGIDLTTDEALMLMYASNLETQIDVGDNMTLEQVIVAHYINLAEGLISNDEDYKGRLVSDVASELMTNDYHSSLAKINNAFIEYGFVAPTSNLIANENDSKVLADFESALKGGIANDGDFTKANELVKEVFSENSTVLRGTRIIIAGQYSAINLYGQNAKVKITGMEQETFDAIFRDCGGNVDEIGYEAYTTYMTEVRAYLNVYTDQQIIAWNAKVAENKKLEEKATEKYNQINEYVNSNRVELVTPENLRHIEEENAKEDKEAAASLNERLENGGELVTDSKGNQSIIVDKVTEEEKEAIEKADKEKAEQNAEIKYENGYSEDKDGNIIDSDGNKMDAPVDDAPIMTEEEIKEIEDKAEDLLEENDGVIKEEFIPLDNPIVVEETKTEIVDGEVVSSTTEKINDLKELKEQLNTATNNTEVKTETEVKSDEFNPVEDVVTYNLEEGWMIDENGNATLAPGYTFDASGNVVKVNVK